MRRLFWDHCAPASSSGDFPALRLASDDDAAAAEEAPLSLPARIEVLEQRMMLSAAAPGHGVGAALPVSEPPVQVVVSSSITGPIAAPAAAASGIAQSVALKWSVVSGASGYAVQRSNDGGTTWNTIGSALTADQTTAGDFDYNNGARLLPSTTYFYRLAAFDSGNIAHYSDATSVTTSAKRFYDDTVIVGKPDLSRFGLNGSYTTSALERTVTSSSGATQIYLDQDLFNAAAAMAVSEHAVFVIDLENIKLTVSDTGGAVLGDFASADPVQQVINDLSQVVTAIDLARQAVPGVQIGWHGMWRSTPYENASTNDFDAALWSGRDLYASPNAARDNSYDLLSRLNLVSPENYFWQGQTLGFWRSQLLAATQLWRADLELDGNSAAVVVPGLSPELYSDTGSQPLPMGTWSAMLASVNSDPNSEGIRIWAADKGQFGVENWNGPDQQAWWNQTLQVLDESSTALPGAPVISSQSPSAIAWTYPRTADGFVVERSIDGQWPDALSFDSTQPDCVFLVAGGEGGTFTDSSALSDVSYSYRVRAISAFSFSEWSDSVAAITPVDGTASFGTYPNPVTQWTSGLWNYAYGTGLSGTTTLYYSAMDLGSAGVDQVSMILTEWSPGNDYRDGTLEVFIDRDPTNSANTPTAIVPLIESPYQGATSSDVSVTGAIPFSQGVHAVWLRFIPPADHPWASAAVRALQFSTAESHDVILTATASSSIYLKLDSDGQTLDAWQNSTPTQGAPTSRYILANINSFLIQGSGDTTLTVDGTNGNPLPNCMLTFTGGSGANRLQVIGTPGDDVFLYQGWPTGDLGAWSSAVSFDWRRIALPDNIVVSYSTNGGTDSIGLRTGATLTLVDNPYSGASPQPIRLGAVTLGVGSTLIAPGSGAIEPAPSQRAVLVVDSLAMMSVSDLSSVNNPLLLPTLDLRDSDLIVKNLDVFGFDIDPFLSTVTQAALGHAAVSQVPLNPWNWTGDGIISSLATVQTPAPAGTFDGIAVNPAVLLFQTA